MPNRHFSKFIKGFIDPLSLIAIGFLLVSIIVAVVSVNNKQNTLNIGSKAACLEEMMCPANKCPNDYYCNKGCCIKNTSSTATTKNCLTRTCKGNSCQSSSTTISSTKTCPSSDCKVDGDCKNPNISTPPTTTPITTTACIDPCVNDTDCGAKGYCYKPAGGCPVCKIQTCNPGDKQCTNGSLRECNSIGSTWNTLKTCPDGCNLEGNDCKEAPSSVVVPECTKLSEKADCDQGYVCLNFKCVKQTSTNSQTPLAPTSTQTKYACNSSTGACRLDSTGSYTSSSACTSSCKAPPVTGYTPEKDRIGWSPSPEDIANGPDYYAEKNCCGGFKSGFYCGTDCGYKLIDNPDTRAAYQKALQSQSNIVSEYTDEQLLSYAKDNGIKTCSDTDKACIEQAINLALNSLINNIDEITPFVKEEDKTSIINSVTEARNINKDVAYYTTGKNDADLANEYCSDKYSNSPELISVLNDCISNFDRNSLLNGIIANQAGIIPKDQIISFYNEILKSNMDKQYFADIFLDLNISPATAVKLWCQKNSISYDSYSQCIKDTSREDLLAGLPPEVIELYKTAYQAAKDQATSFITSARQIFFDIALGNVPDKCQKVAINSLDPGEYDRCLNSEFIWKTLHSDAFSEVDPELMKTMAEQIKTDLSMNANDIRMAIKYLNPKNSDQQLAEEYCKGDRMCYRYFNRDILLSLFTPEAKNAIKDIYNTNLMAYTSSVVETVIDQDMATAATVGNTYSEILNNFNNDYKTINRIRDLSEQEQQAFAVFSKDAKDSIGYWQSPNDLAITFFQVVNKQENPAGYISELSSIYKNRTDSYITYMPIGWNSETEYNAFDIGMIHYLTNNSVIHGLTDDNGKLLSYNNVSADYQKQIEETVTEKMCDEASIQCLWYSGFSYGGYGGGPARWIIQTPEGKDLLKAEIQENSNYYLQNILKEERPPSLLNAGKLNTFTIDNVYLDPEIRQEALDKAEALINNASRNDLSFYSGNFRETVVGKTKIDKDKELLDQIRKTDTISGVGTFVSDIDKDNPLYQQALESAANDYLFRTYGTESYARGGGALQAFAAGFTVGAGIGSLCGPGCALAGGIGAGLSATAITLSPIYGQATSAEIQMEKMGFSSIFGGSDLWGGVAQAMVISQGAWSSDKNNISGDEVFGNWGGHIGRSSSEINNSFGYSTLLQSRLYMENLTFEQSIAMTPLILDKWSERQVIEQSQAEANVVVNIGTSLILGGAGRSLGLAAGAKSLLKTGGNIVASTMTSNLVEGVAQVTAGFAINATQNAIQFSQNQGNEELLSTQGQVDLQNCRRNGGDCSLYEAKVAGDTQQAYLQTLLTQTLTDVVMNSGQGVANFIKTSTDINNAQTKLRGGLPLTRNEYDALAQIGYLPDRNNIPSISNGLVYDNAGGRLIDNAGNTVLNYNKSTGKFTDKSGKEVYNFVADLFTAETDASGNTRWRNNKNGQFASALEVGNTIVKKIGGAIADIAPKTPAVGDSGSKPPIGGVENKITPPKATTISDNPITRAVNSIANLINNSSPIKRMSPENKTAAKASLQTKISVDSIKTVQDVKNLTKIDGLTNDEKTIVKNIDKGISDYEKAFGRPPRDYQIQDGIKGYLGIPDPNSPAESKIFTNLILMEGGGAGKTSVIMPTIAKLYAEEGQIAWISFADTRGLNDGKSQMNKVSGAFNGIDRIIFNKDTGFSTLDGKPVSNETVISMAKAKGKGFVVMSTIADLAWNNQRVSSSNSSEAIGTILSRPEGAHLIVDEPGASAGRTWSSTFTESKIADMPKSMLGGLESGNDIVKISSLAENLPSLNSFRNSVIDTVRSGASTKNMFEGTSGKGIPRDKTIIANTRKEIIDTLISHFETSSVGNETERTKIVTLLKEIRSNGDQGEFLIQYDNLRKLPSTTPELNELITQLNHLDTAVVSRWNVLSMVPENQMGYNADTKTISLTSGEQFSTAHMLIALQSEGSRLLNARGIETANLISANDLSISLKSRQINLKGVIDLFTSVTATDATPHIAAADLGLYVKGTAINPSSPTRLFTGSDQSVFLASAVDAIPTNKAGSIVIGDTDTPFRTTERNVISNRNRKLQENGQSVEKVVRINDAGYFLETLDKDGNIVASKEIISTDPSKTETEVLFTELGPNLRNKPESVLIFFENKTRQVDLPVDPNLRWVNYLSDDLNSETLVQSTVRNRIQDKVNRAGGDTQKVANDLNAENKEKGDGIVWTKEDVEESLKYDLWLTTNKDGLTTDNVVSEVFDKNYQTEIKLKKYESELAEIDSVYKNLLVELSDGKTNLGLDAETATKVKVLIDDLLDQESRASQVRFDNILDRGSEGYDIVREYYNRAAKAQNNLVELGNKLKLAGVPESVISKMLTDLQLNKTTNILSADEFAALWHENQLVSTTDKPISPIDKAIAYASSKSAADQLPDVYNHGDKGNIPLTEFKASIDTALADKAKTVSKPIASTTIGRIFSNLIKPVENKPVLLFKTDSNNPLNIPMGIDLSTGRFSLTVLRDNLFGKGLRSQVLNFNKKVNAWKAFDPNLDDGETEETLNNLLSEIINELTNSATKNNNISQADIDLFTQIGIGLIKSKKNEIENNNLASKSPQEQILLSELTIEEQIRLTELGQKPITLISYLENERITTNLPRLTVNVSNKQGEVASLIIYYNPANEQQAQELKSIYENINITKTITPEDNIRISQLLGYTPGEIDDFIQRRYPITPTPEQPVNISIPINQPLSVNKNITKEELNFFKQIPKNKDQNQFTKEMLLKKEFIPTKVIETRGNTYYISKILNRGRYSYAVMYAQNSVTGYILPRVLYKSNSDGVWRSTPGFEAYNNIFSKGAGYHYTQETKLNFEISKFLDSGEFKTGSIKYDPIKTYFNLAAVIINKSNTFSQESSKFDDQGQLKDLQVYKPGKGFNPNNSFQIVPELIVNNFATVKYPDGFIPNFKNGPIRTEIGNHTLLGKLTYEFYEATLSNRPTEWIVAYDGKGRVWVSSITFKDGGINSYGTPIEVIDSGALTNKPLEYKTQSYELISSGLAVPFDADYNDITPLLAKLRPIQEFKDALAVRPVSQIEQTIKQPSVTTNLTDILSEVAIAAAKAVNQIVRDIIQVAGVTLSKIDTTPQQTTVKEETTTKNLSENPKEQTTNNLDNQPSPPSTNNITPVTRALISEARRAEYEAKFGKDVLDKIVQQTNPIVNKYFNDDELITDLHDYLFPGTNTKEEFQSKLKTISDLIAIIDKPSIQNKNLVGKLALQLKYLGPKNSQDILDTLFFVSDETQEYLLEVLTEVEESGVTNAVLGEAMHSNPSYTDAVINLVKFGYQNKINAKTIVKVIENCNFNEFVKSFGQNKGVPISLSDEPAKMIENYISLVTYLNKNSYNKNFSEIVAGMILADSYVNLLLTGSSDMDVFQTSKLTDYLIEKNVNDEDVVRASTGFKKMSFGDEDESDQIISWLEDIQTFFPIESKYYPPIVYELIQRGGVDRFKERFEKYPLHLLTSMDELGYLSNLFSYSLFSRLESIEQQRPGISKFLRDKFGITFIDRYSEKNLIDIYDNWNSDILSGKPYGLIVYARVDQGGAFTQAEIPIEKAAKNLRENGYIPIFLEVSGKQEYVNRLLKISKELGSSRKASFILILAHGTPNSFHLGKEKLNSKNDNIVQISDLSSTGTEKIKKYYEVGLPFGFISCSTGVECGIAQEFATTFGSVAVGPNEPTNVKSVIPQYDSSGKIISFNIEYSSQDIAKVYRAGLLETVLNATPNQLNFASQQQPNDVAKQLTGNVISTNSFENMSSALEGFVFEDNLSEITNNKPVLLSATIFPFLSAQAMEDWSEKYIYSKYPGSKEKGITPIMFYRGVQAWLKDTRAIILNSITRRIEFLLVIKYFEDIPGYLKGNEINEKIFNKHFDYIMSKGDKTIANLMTFNLGYLLEISDKFRLSNSYFERAVDFIIDKGDSETAGNLERNLYFLLGSEKISEKYLTKIVDFIIDKGDSKTAWNLTYNLYSLLNSKKISEEYVTKLVDFIIDKGDSKTAEKLANHLYNFINSQKISEEYLTKIVDFIIDKGDSKTAEKLTGYILYSFLNSEKISKEYVTKVVDFIIDNVDSETTGNLAGNLPSLLTSKKISESQRLKMWLLCEKFANLDLANKIIYVAAIIPDLYQSMPGIFKLSSIVNEQERGYIFNEIFKTKGGDSLVLKINSKTLTENEKQQVLGEARKIIAGIIKDFTQFKAKISSGATLFTDYEYQLLDMYLQEIHREHKNDYFGPYEEIAQYFNIPDWESKPRYQVLKEIDKQLKTVPLTPVTYSFDMPLKEISLTLPDEYAQNFRKLLQALPALSDEEKATILQNLKNQSSVTDLIPQLLDITTRASAIQQILNTLDNPAQMTAMQNKINGVLNSNLSTELKQSNLQKMLSASMSLSAKEQSVIFNTLIDNANLKGTITDFINGQFASEDQGATLIRLMELETVHLPDLISSMPELAGVKDRLESTELWKAIKEIKKQVLETQQKQQKNIQNIQLVLGNRTILDVWQGISSGTCFGDSPAHLSKRENIVPIKMVKDGELFGNALTIIQGNRIILIGFDPSESFTGATTKESMREFVDKSLSGIKWIAEQNGWEFMIGNPDETGGLTNRKGDKFGNVDKILNEYIKGQSQVDIDPEAELQPQYGYTPEHAYKLSDEINKILDSNMVKQNTPLRIVENATIVDSANNISPLDGCSLCSTEFLPGLKEILAKMDISEESQKQVLKEARTYVTNHMNNKEGSEVKNMALMQTIDFLLAKEQAYVDDKLSLFEKIRLLNEMGQAQRAVKNKNGVTQDENGTTSLNELAAYLNQEADNVNNTKIYTFLNSVTDSLGKSKLAENVTKVTNTNEGRHINFGDISVIENTENNISDEEFAQYQEGYKLFTELVNNASNPDEKTVLSSGVFFKTIMGLDSIAIFTPNEAKLLYRSLKKANSLDQFAPIIFTNGSGTESIQFIHLQKVVALLRQYQTELGINIPDGVLSNDQIFKILDSLINGTDLKKKHIVAGLLSAFPESSVIWWVNSRSAINDLHNFSIKQLDEKTKTFLESDLPIEKFNEVDLGNYYVTPYLKYGDIQIDASTKMVGIGGLGIYFSAQYPLTQDVSTYLQKLIEIDRRLGVTGFIDKIRKQISTSNTKEEKSNKIVLDSKAFIFDLASLLFIAPEASRNKMDDAGYEPSGPILNWIFHHIGSIFEVGVGFMLIRITFFLVNVLLTRMFQVKIPSKISFWASILGSSIYVSLLELDVITLWPFYPGWYLNVVPDYPDLFGIWFFAGVAIAWHYGVPLFGKLYLKIVTGSVKFPKPQLTVPKVLTKLFRTSNKSLTDISTRERMSMSTDRNLEYYLKQTHLNPEDLNNKVIVNLGAGGTDIGRDIQNFNKENGQQIKPSQVVNIDLKYPRKYEGGMPEDAVKANILSVPLSDGVADIIFSAWSLSVWIPREKQAYGYLEATRLLKDGGVAYIFPLGGKSLKAKDVASVIKEKLINAEVSYDKKNKVLTIKKTKVI